MDYLRNEEFDIERRSSGDGLEARPTTDLVKEFFDNARILVKEELALAKVEARREAKKAAAAGASVGAGGAILYVGAIMVAATLTILGDLFLPLWLSALIVTVLFLAVGAVMAAGGAKKLKNINPKRTDTARTLKEDKAWAKEAMQSVKSRRRVHA